MVNLSTLFGPKPAVGTFPHVQDVDTIYHRQGCRHFCLGDFAHLGSRYEACQDWEERTPGPIYLDFSLSGAGEKGMLAEPSI